MLAVNMPKGNWMSSKGPRVEYLLCPVETPEDRASVREEMRGKRIKRLPVVAFTILGPCLAEQASTGDWLLAEGTD